MKSLQNINYLKKLDLFYKYENQNVFSIPKIKQITFLLSIKNFLKAYDYEYSNIKETSTTHVKAFLFLYLSFSQIPFILVKESKKKVKYREEPFKLSVDLLYTLKLSFISLKSLQKFFYFFILENFNFLNACTFLNQIVFAKKKKINSNNTTLLQGNFACTTSATFNFLIQRFFEEINLKELKFNLNILLAKPLYINDNGLLFKNLALI